MTRRPSRSSEAPPTAAADKIEYAGIPVPKDTRHPQAIDIRRITYETAIQTLGNILSQISCTSPETTTHPKIGRPSWSTEAREFLSSYERPSDPEQICKAVYDRLLALKTARTPADPAAEPGKTPQLHVEDILLLAHMIFSFDDGADLEIHAAEYPLKLFVFGLASYAHRVFHDGVDEYPYEEFKRDIIAELRSMGTMPKHKGTYHVEGEPDKPKRSDATVAESDSESEPGEDTVSPPT